MAEKKEKQYVSDNAQLMAEWDWDKNMVFDPYSMALGSGKKVSWICKTCNNHWEATISNRAGRSSGCPFCAGKYPILGQTDLSSQFPKIACQWDYENNGDLKPSDVTTKSSKKVYWVCENGHRWESTIANRTSNHGCPYCTGKLPIIGETDLATRFPHIASQWDYTKNGKLTPHDITSKSNKSVWWLCEYGHSWRAPIYRRVNGHGCPTCAHHLQKSFPETAVYYYVSKYFKDTIQSYKSPILGKFEFDIFVPFLNVAIEYDGKAYHDKKHSLDREKRKYEISQKYKIFLIRVREGEKSSPNCDAVVFTKLGELYLNSPKYNTELARVINQVFGLLGITNTISIIDIENDQLSISSLLYKNALQNDGLGKLAGEWDYEKNAPLSPNMLTLGSNQKVYWRCENGHSWLASLKERAGGENRKGTGCPYCSGSKVIVGFNDIETTNPELLCEWDFEKNTVLPTEISKGYNGKIWWKCSKGHTWQAKIASRIHQKTGCPYCSNKKVLVGYNDLKTAYPSIANEWHPHKNEGITPQNFTAGSHRKVWWLCSKCGYECNISIRDRVKRKSCPLCGK